MQFDERKFKVSKYKTPGFYGICLLDKRIPVGNIDDINSHEVIKYENRIKIDDDSYPGIALVKEIDWELAEEICEIFEVQSRNFPRHSFSQIINSISDIFKRIREESFLKNYIGLLGELSFIKKAKTEGFDIGKYYQSGINTMDFRFENNLGVDVKVVNRDSKSVILSDEQLDEIHSSESKILAIIPFYDRINGLSVRDLYDSFLEDNHSYPYLTNVISRLENSDMNLFDNYKIDISKSTFIWLNKEMLPKIQIQTYLDEVTSKHKTSLISAKFKIFVSENIQEKTFNEILGEITKHE